MISGSGIVLIIIIIIIMHIYMQRPHSETKDLYLNREPCDDYRGAGSIDVMYIIRVIGLRIVLKLELKRILELKQHCRLIDR
jgi:hypothetical protein